jgi:hypothetical protein
MKKFVVMMLMLMVGVSFMSCSSKGKSAPARSQVAGPGPKTTKPPAPVAAAPANPAKNEVNKSMAEVDIKNTTLFFAFGNDENFCIAKKENSVWVHMWFKFADANKYLEATSKDSVKLSFKKKTGGGIQIRDKSNKEIELPNQNDSFMVDDEGKINKG